MFSGKDAANPAYPTQWALNPSAYQNMDSSQVDWAALAQQWIAMKEAAAIVAAPPPPAIRPDAEEGEAPMEVENTDTNSDGQSNDWNSGSNTWGGSWNQWGWGWSASGPVDPKLAADPAIAMAPMIDGYTVPSDGSAAMPGYTTGTVPAPTFQHGYWTAPQAEQNSSRSSSSSRSRDRRSKSKNRDQKSTKSTRSQREKPPVLPPVVEPIVMPATMPTTTIDAAKRRQLPAWIREGLEKMEREKQRAIEREQEKKARETAEKEKKKLEEAELERMKAEAGGQPMIPPKSKFESDSEGEDTEKEEQRPNTPNMKTLSQDTVDVKEERPEPPPLIKKSKEDIMHEVMQTVRRSLTEILLEVTDSEIHTVSQEELARYNAVQASRLNAMKASKSKALAAIASGLGLGAYESSSEDSGEEEDQRDVSDQQLMDIIKRKRQDFERTSREIEADVRRAELRETLDEPTTPVNATPERPRRKSSATPPPPIDGDTPEKVPERRISRDKRSSHRTNDRVDGIRRLDSIPEEKPKKSSKKDHTPSPQKHGYKTNNKGSSASSTSDSENDSLSSSTKSTVSEVEVKIEHKQAKKRKRRNTSSSDSQKKSKKEKQKKDKSHKSEDKNSHSKSKHEDYERSDKSRSKKKDDYYDKHKSSRSRDYERSHKEKYRDESEDDRPRKRSKRSRSISYESRSVRRKTSRDRSEERSRKREKRSYDRESSKRDRSYDRSGRDYDKYDRYERSRDYDRRRSRSGSHGRHRR